MITVAIVVLLLRTAAFAEQAGHDRLQYCCKFCGLV